MATLKISHTTKGNAESVVVVLQEKHGKVWEDGEEVVIPDGGEVEVEVNAGQRVQVLQEKPKK